jgi:hypothetical protein
MRLASLEMDMLTAATMSSSHAPSNPFGDDDNALGGTVPHSPFLMTPGVIDLLTSMGKAPGGASDPANPIPVAKTRAAT